MYRVELKKFSICQYVPVAILKIPHWYTFPTDEGAKLVKLLHINGLAFSEQPYQKVNVLVLK
jgi:hypothetical protein